MGPPPKVDPELLLLELELKGELLFVVVEVVLVVEEENGLVEVVGELEPFAFVLVVADVPTLTQPPALPEEFVELPELLVEPELPELFELFVAAYIEPPLLAIDAALVAPLRATAEAASG